MAVNLSIIYGMAFDLVLFLLLYEYRCSPKVFRTVTAVSISLMSAALIWTIFQYGLLTASRAAVMVCSVPSFLVFLVLARYRGARYIFTFCLADTAAMWVMQLSNIIGYFTGDAATVLLRLIAYPALAFAVWRRFRRPYLDAIHTVERGWWLLCVITAVFYAAMILAASYPTLLRERPEGIPLALLLLTLLPLVYFAMFTILRQQQEMYAAREGRRILQAQTAMMERRVGEVRSAEERLRIERHDLRHRLDMAQALVEGKNAEGALALLSSARTALDEATPRRYCQNTMLDAVFSLYFRRAGEAGIDVEAQLAIPEELQVDAAELCTVFSNALDNALRACAALPAGRRMIRCICVNSPALVFEVANTCAGEVRFDGSGLPISAAQGHGIGVRSIAAFCEKHGAVCLFEARDGWFKLTVTM